jgi:hypothetical protein
MGWLLGWLLFTPIFAIFISFALLCAWNCEAGPWLTFKFAPVLTLIGWLIVAAIFSKSRTSAKDE